MFHKTLEDAKKAFLNDDFKLGWQIIQSHLSELQKLGSPLNMLDMKSQVYKDSLLKINSVQGISDPRVYARYKAAILQALDNAEKALWVMRQLTKQLADEELKLT